MVDTRSSGSNVMHVVCVRCWSGMGIRQKPIRAVDPVEEWCCWCSRFTASGILRRQVPPPDWCEGKLGRHQNENPTDPLPALPVSRPTDTLPMQ